MMNEKMEQVLKQQKQQMDEPRIDDNEDIIQLVGFVVGEEEFAVPILSIKEIIKPLDYTRVPKTPSYVLGVFNMRGSVLPLVDLKNKFGMPPTKFNEDTRVIVLKNDKDEQVGFVIEELSEAIRIKESDIEPAPEGSGKDNLIYGVGKKDDRLITILRVEALLKRDF
jgi:purine-binding chemotaxis protein CheW